MNRDGPTQVPNNPLFFELTGLFVGLGFTLKKKAFAGIRRAAESGARGNDGDKGRAMDSGGGGGGGGGGGEGLAHLEDFKWWIGLTAIGLGARVR